MVRIQLFDGVSATTDVGEPLDVGSARSQAVLAALALSPGSAVPVWRLVELAWADAPPENAEKALQWHVVRLRKGLGPGVIVRTGAAYRLDLDPEAIDVARFQRRLDEGDTDAALAEWTGTPLAGLDAPGLTATVAGLTERWLGAVETDLERRVEADAKAAIGPLTELTARHPFREGLLALLMTALYRVGCQADALAAFRGARQHLVEQLGVEPGPRLRELESFILDHDERLGATVAHVASRSRGNLPRRPGRLIGRDDDLRTIAEAFERSPVVTLVGPGGIGKTRLALASGRTAEEAWLVDLAEICSSSEVSRACADALDVAERPGRTLTQSIVTVLRSRPALIVIDNCEHVLDGAAKLAHALAEGCARVRVLATSRERLGIDAEQVVAVGPLDRAAGIELFEVRASAADRTFDPAAHRPEIDDICRRLDGIPLAIELAAARTRSLRPADLVARLDDRLRLVTGGSPASAVRHRTLRATIQWSYDLLTPSEQALFQRLSIFAGPFDLTAAEAVATGPDVDDLTGGLVERSMVIAESGPLGRRFRLLETMRQFGAEHLQAADDPVAERHARWCLGQVGHIHRLLTGPAEIEGVARLGELWPNLRAAVTWACDLGDPDLADALVRPIATEIALRGRQEIGDWAERILAILPDSDRRAFWFVWIAERNTQNGDHEGFARIVQRHGLPDHPFAHYAQAYLSGDGEALRHYLSEVTAELREDNLAAFVDMMSAGTLLGIGRVQEVDATVSILAARYRAQGPPTLLHWALQTLAYSASFQGRTEEADELFDEAAAVDVPDRTLSAGDLVQARTLFRRGQRQRAFQTLRSYVQEQLDTDNVIAASVVAIEFITMMAAINRLSEASHILEYLKTANDFGALAAETLVADAAAKLTADPETGPRLDDRQALAYMRAVLDQCVS